MNQVGRFAKGRRGACRKTLISPRNLLERPHIRGIITSDDVDYTADARWTHSQNSVTMLAGRVEWGGGGHPTIGSVVNSIVVVQQYVALFRSTMFHAVSVLLFVVVWSGASIHWYRRSLSSCLVINCFTKTTGWCMVTRMVTTDIWYLCCSVTILQHVLRCDAR